MFRHIYISCSRTRTNTILCVCWVKNKLSTLWLKYSKDGDMIWDVVWDGGKDEAFSALNLDSNGNVYLLSRDKIEHFIQMQKRYLEVNQ